MSRHDPSCLCFECIVTETNPYIRRSKLVSAARQICSWDNERQTEWILALCHQVQFSKKKFNNTGPIISILIEEGITPQFLVIIARDYALALPTNETKLEQEKSALALVPRIMSKTGTHLAMVISEVLSSEENKIEQKRILKDIMSNNGFMILCRAVLYGLTILKITCMKVLECLVMHSDNHNTIFIEDSSLRSLVIRTAISVLKLPRDTMLVEIQESRLHAQHDMFPAKQALQGKDVQALDFLEKLYERASLVLYFLLVHNSDYQAIFISEPLLMDTLLTNLSVLPHESHPLSNRHYIIANSIALLTKIPFQLEDTSDDYQQLLLDVYYSTDNTGKRLISVLKQFTNLHVHEYAMKITNSSQIQLAEPLPANAAAITITNMFHSELLILTIFSNLSYEKAIVDDLLNDDYLIHLMMSHLDLVGTSNHWIVDQKKKLEKKDKLMFFEIAQYDGYMIDVTNDIVGTCITILRNILVSDNVVDQYRNIWKHPSYLKWMTLSANFMRDEGVRMLRENRTKIREAMILFSKSLHILPRDTDFDQNLLLNDDVRDLKVTLLSNRAEMYIQMGNIRAAKIDLDISLRMSPNHEKSRRRMERVSKLL